MLRVNLALKSFGKVGYSDRCVFVSWDQRFFDPIILPNGRKLFTLRDANSSKDDMFYRFGVLRDDYSPKPAFGVLRDLIAELRRR